jgi:hypothetical protein
MGLGCCTGLPCCARVPVVTVVVVMATSPEGLNCDCQAREEHRSE